MCPFSSLTDEEACSRLLLEEQGLQGFARLVKFPFLLFFQEFLLLHFFLLSHLWYLKTCFFLYLGNEFLFWPHLVILRCFKQYLKSFFFIVGGAWSSLSSSYPCSFLHYWHRKNCFVHYHHFRNDIAWLYIWSGLTNLCLDLNLFFPSLLFFCSWDWTIQFYRLTFYISHSLIFLALLLPHHSRMKIKVIRFLVLTNQKHTVWIADKLLLEGRT